jgi:hypothetical protein
MWSAVQFPSNTFKALWGANATNIWAVGGGIIRHFNGTTWTVVEQNPQHYYLSVWGTSATDVYAAGWLGVVSHYDGTAWTRVDMPTTEDLATIAGTGPTDIFIAGNETLLHFDGTRWLPMSPRGLFIEALWATVHDIVVANGPDTWTLVRACATCL